MNTRTLLGCLLSVNDAIAANASEIEALDRHIGDGDHLVNIQRGCAALLAMRDGLAVMSPPDALNAMGIKLLSTIGGASGPLLASFLMAMAKSLKAQPGSDTDGGAVRFADAFSTGVDAIRMRGKADLGEKTMLDVLIPVARLLSRLANEGAPRELIGARLIEEAQRGMLATKDMIATKGRAYFLGERAIGHIDPGARTSQVAIQAICEHLAAQSTQS